MFIIINEISGEFVAVRDIVHVGPKDDGETGSYIYLREEGAPMLSDLTPRQILHRCFQSPA